MALPEDFGDRNDPADSRQNRLITDRAREGGRRDLQRGETSPAGRGSCGRRQWAQCYVPKLGEGRKEN